MLISSDISAASNSGLRPLGISAIKSVATVRAATVATVQYTEYPVAPLGTENVVISYTFDPNSISVGTQVRARVYGTMDASVGGFSPTIWVAQPNNTNITQVSYGSSGTLDSWIIDAVFSFSVYNDVTGVPFTSRNQGRPSSTSSMAIRGLVDLKTGGPLGIIDERMNTVLPLFTPNLVDGSQPMQLYVSINSDIPFTVHGGWMEAL